MEKEVIKQDVQFKFVVNDEKSTLTPEDGMAYIFTEKKFLPIVGIKPQGIEMSIPKPGRESLQRGIIGDTEGLIQGSPQVIYELDSTKGNGTGIEYTNDGIFVYHKELLYPKKGFPYPEACQANNVIKRAFMGSIRAFSSNPLMAVLLLRTKTLEKFLHEYCSFAEITIDPFFWKPEYYSKTSKEIEKFITTFLTALGFTNRPDLPGKIISHFLEFDDAYMFLVQDLANEATVERLLENPAKELTRLYTLFKIRESRTSMKGKIKGIFFLFKLMFFIPKFRRAFKKAIKESTFENFQMEDCDRYQILRWDSGYNFLGKSPSDRIGEFMKMHKGIIPRFNVVGVK